VWKAFRDAFEARNLTSALTPKRITAPDYDYEFDRAWRNGVWNVYEPVSPDLTDGDLTDGDLADGTTILDKANSWLGKATTLSRSSEAHQIYLLVGAPHREGLETVFSRAQNILRRAPDVKIVHESEADQFAARLAREMAEHGVST
jgi:hypothetical protein